MGKMDDDGGIGAEVTSRLDELFGEDDGADAPVQETSSKKPLEKESPVQKRNDEAAGSGINADESPIGNLKALVFGIDWEITDEAMISFLKEVRRLHQQYQDDKILSMFLKLHDSIGKYIKAKKARAHPDAIKFVTSVYKNFEKVLLTPGMPEKEKKRLLSGEVKKFKDFKQRVVSREKAMVTGAPMVVEKVEVESTPAAVAPEKSGIALDNREALEYIVEEIKKTIKAEFHTIRQILKNLGA